MYTQSFVSFRGNTYLQPHVKCNTTHLGVLLTPTRARATRLGMYVYTFPVILMRTVHVQKH